MTQRDSGNKTHRKYEKWNQPLNIRIRRVITNENRNIKKYDREKSKK